ncbi:MAG: MoaD/ThiS family protein [Actinobacteria bacterium]|nr:MoaD/ThiS family protein [Actinomycetota bacterium]
MITVRFFAAARDAAGISQAQVDAENLHDLIEILSKENSHLRRILEQCSFLVDGLIVHDRDKLITPGSAVDVLPPFAGG